MNMKKIILTLATLGSFALPLLAQDTPPKDNTAVNERDRTGDTLTPGDQSNAPEDIKITQAIRQALVKDDSLSTNAKNVKIITIHGQVTLRGTVNSQEEKATIAKLATAAATDAKIDNQLEIKSN
jgi:hyperosmotically inducible protein